MKIVERSFEIISPAANESGKISFLTEKERIELAARTAYRTEDKLNMNPQFISSLIRRGHESPFEFGDMTVKVITDRGVTHELVRHRIASYLQESTRYCNYSKEKFGKEISVIMPEGIVSEGEFKAWRKGCKGSQKQYFAMIKEGATTERARAVLPTCLKAEIMIKMNFRAWRHFFRVRVLNKEAHLDMRATFKELYKVCQAACPEIFDLGEYQE